jgi:hypothetical protein
LFDTAVKLNAARSLGGTVPQVTLLGANAVID